VTALLRAELIKLSTTRTFVALVGAAVATSLLIASLSALLGDPSEENVLTDVFLADTSGLFVMLLAIIGISGEWRHRTITSSLLAAPLRVRFLIAKALAYSVAGLIMSAAVTLAVAVVGWTLLSVQDKALPEMGDLVEQIARTVPISLLPGAFGVALGSVLRNTTFAVVTVLLLSFLIEPTVSFTVPEVGRWGPTTALPAAAAGLEASDIGFDEVPLPSAGAALLALFAWIGGLFALGAVLLKTRDLD
jgi:ABC-2 type transport system permease protein